MTTWHPGRENETAQEVEVMFTAEGTGTRVELTHRNWALLGERAEEMRESYVQGWDLVLGLYASQVKTLELS
ncbi:MAG: SRPBCC domain-containing protein [Chloroflexota bacterium]